MTRYSLLLAVALVALLGFATAAGAQEGEYDTSVLFFFGECEEEEYEDLQAASGFLDGCHGFGIFIGAWDRESILAEIAYEAVYEFGGAWQVDKIKALNLGHAEESFFGFDTYECIQEPVGEQSGGGDPWGVWIVFFSVEPCEPEGSLVGDWTILANTAIGCAANAITFNVEFSGFQFPSGLGQRTIVTAGGLVYMDELAGPVIANGPQAWSIYASSTGGPTTGTFPIPNDTEIVIEFWLTDGPGGALLRGTRVTIDKCNGGTVTDTEPLPDTPV